MNVTLVSALAFAGLILATIAVSPHLFRAAPVPGPAPVVDAYGVGAGDRR